MLPFVTGWFVLGLFGGSSVASFPLSILSAVLVLAVGLIVAERRGILTLRQGTIAYGAVAAGLVHWPLVTLWFSPVIPWPDADIPIVVQGRIVEPVQVSPDRMRLVLEVGSTPATPEALVPRRSRTDYVRLTWRAPDRALKEGDRIEVAARWHPPRGTHNPGGFDYGDYIVRQGIVAVGTVSGPNAVRVLESGGDSWRWALWAQLDRWRQQIAHAAAASLDASLAGIFLGLVTGDQGTIDPSTREAFVATGTVHILSISGSHLGLLAVLTFVTARLACRWLPASVLLRLNRSALTPTRLAACATIPLVSLYALLAGAEVATVRALTMMLLWIVALWIGRPRVLLPVLCASAILTLLADPQALYDVSFQLSYGSVLALAWVLDGRRSTDGAAAPSGDLTKWASLWAHVRQAWWLSLVVTAVTIPMVALHFHQLPWISPLANLLLLPFSAVLVPLCLLSAGWTVITGADVLAAAPLIHWCLWGFAQSVQLLARMPLVDWHVAAPSVMTLVAYYALVMTVGRSGLAQRRIAAAAGLAVLTLWWMWPHRTLPPDQVRITMLDVGQGDATLLELPSGETLLIDAGARYDRYDVGAAVVGPLLWDRGITRLDHVIATHPQLDHVGGLPWVLRHFPVGHYWGNGMARDEVFYRDLQAALHAAQLHERIPTLDEPLIDRGACRVSAMGQSQGESAASALTPAAMGGRRDASGSALNNASIVTRLECGPHIALFPGDTEASGLERMRQGPGIGGATILKVPHHGARSSLHRPWLQTLHLQIAVVSAGAHNQYHHPHPLVVEAYGEEGVRLLRTDQDGAVSISASTTSNRFSVTTAQQFAFEPVILGDEMWRAEWRNLIRLCGRLFDALCRSAL